MRATKNEEQVWALVQIDTRVMKDLPNLKEMNEIITTALMDHGYSHKVAVKYVRNMQLTLNVSLTDAFKEAMRQVNDPSIDYELEEP